MSAKTAYSECMDTQASDSGMRQRVMYRCSLCRGYKSPGFGNTPEKSTGYRSIFIAASTFSHKRSKTRVSSPCAFMEANLF